MLWPQVYIGYLYAVHRKQTDHRPVKQKWTVLIFVSFYSSRYNLFTECACVLVQEVLETEILKLFCIYKTLVCGSCNRGFVTARTFSEASMSSQTLVQHRGFCKVDVFFLVHQTNADYFIILTLIYPGFKKIRRYLWKENI